MHNYINKKQIEKLSDITSDIGLVILASVALPAVLDKFSLINLVLGTLVSCVFWLISLKLRK